jgi:UDP-glucose 4-epimerase
MKVFLSFNVGGEIEKMRVLITGVAGFIGSNLAHGLLAKGWEVVGLDNMSQGDERNLDGLLGANGFEFHTGDVCDQAAVDSAMEGCERVVHLAAYKIPRYSDALDTLTINSVGSECVAKAAVKNKSKVVAASTSDVYGKNSDVPFSETSNLVMGNPDVKRWAYAISKMFDEQLFFAYHDRFEIDVVMLRFFGGYGPNQNLSWWGGPQSVFINKALDDEEIEVHGDGLQTRSFTYISDHIDGITRCVEKSEANNEVFNLGNTFEITILDLAKMIWRLIRGQSSEPKISLVPYSTFGKYEDVRRRIPNVDKAKSLLGFTPQIDLEDGLVKTILWQVERRRVLGQATVEPACAVGTDA